MTVSVNACPPAVVLFGDNDVIAGTGATTWKGAGLDNWPSGLVTWTVQVSGSFPVVIDICSS
ncbi:MAG: hypothetical protein ACREIC_21820, partial [Limisphaerales bacterium]